MSAIETDRSEEPTAHELLIRVEGVGAERATALLDHVGSGMAVAMAAASAWGRIVEVDGFSEDSARSLFPRMRDAGVYDRLRNRDYREEDS